MKLILLLMFTIIYANAHSQSRGTQLPQKYNGYGLPNTQFKKINLEAKPNRPQGASRSEPQPMEPKKEGLGYSLALDISPTYSIQGEKQTDGSQSQFMYYELNPKIEFTTYKIVGAFFYNQNLIDAKDHDWDDSALNLTRKSFEPFTYLLITPFLSYGLPLSKKSREVALLTSTLGTSFVFGLNSKAWGSPELTLNYSLGYTKMFSKSNTNAKGESNVDFRIRQRVNFGYALTDAVSFKMRFEFNSLYNYSNEISNAFLHYEQIEYKFNDYFGMNLGHTNSGGLFNPETYENNLKAYDSKSSEFYLGCTVSLNY
ncbi:MAG: hypothetical protein H7061_13945 [Bdellovibrionaceae bacterium]|nr:hypothetical protein [Bdellovibrio sp.]